MSVIRLSGAQWRERRRAHEERAGAALARVVDRRSRGERHPVEDFMFDYYRLRPAELLQWHPGVGIELEDAAEFSGRRFHRVDEGVASVDVEAVLAKRAGTLAFTHRLLSATADRPAHFGCFGMHEWAMVHGLGADQLRHPQLSLRLSQERTAQVVERSGLRCSHFDAYRFFTDSAVGLNQQVLTRETQMENDQPGCLHVNMDLYKWAGKLTPLVGSELLFDTYLLALDIRGLDMAASPYDLSEWGHRAVEVEQPAGKAEYVARQRGFSRRAHQLRGGLLDLTAGLVARASA